MHLFAPKLNRQVKKFQLNIILNKEKTFRYYQSRIDWILELSQGIRLTYLIIDSYQLKEEQITSL